MYYGKDHRIPCTDHSGNSYPSIQDMCTVYGINPETYSRRIKIYKMSIEEALTKPVKPNGGHVCFDHNGKRFHSITKMCAYWHIDRKTFSYRFNHGWSLEAALTTPTSKEPTD